MEGGVFGVIIKNGFESQVSGWQLNLAVAVATGAPYFSNLLSYYWVKLSRGRRKARLVSNLAISFCFCTLSIAFIPFNKMGLFLFLLILVTARVLWSGILTIRSNIWRANYPRRIRGKVTAKLATLAALIMSISGMTVGFVLDWSFDYFRWVFVVFSLVSLVGAIRYRSLSVRNQQKEILQESKKEDQRSLISTFKLLTENKSFGKYMLALFILGSGNLMFMAPLIVFFNDHTDLSQLRQILITSAIPLALIPIAVSWWAKLLDANHIFHFRSIHSWAFVGALFVFFIAQRSGFTPLFFIGAIFYGIAISGGFIGWNLGHNDFADADADADADKNSDTKNNKRTASNNSMDYMAVHVTLTGLRGLIMPLIGISFYQWLENQSVGQGRYALLLPLFLTMTGAILFVVFDRQNKRSGLT